MKATTKIKLRSKNFPVIEYTPGDDVWIIELKREGKKPFSFDVSEELTGDKQAMTRVASALDMLDEMEKAALGYIKSTARDRRHPEHKTVRDYFAFHREEAEKMTRDGSSQLFGPEKQPARYTADHLALERLASALNKERTAQIFLMDFTIDSFYSNNLLVVLFDNNFTPRSLSMES